MTKRNISPKIARLRGQVARRQQLGEPVDDLRAELRTEVLAESIAKAVADWPPLSQSQKARLAALLAPAPENASLATDVSVEPPVTHETHITIARQRLRAGDAPLASAHAAMAVYELLSRIATTEEAEPAWQRNDLVRFRHEGVEFQALLQAPGETLMRLHDGRVVYLWDAMVTRLVSSQGPIVGSTVQLPEGDEACQLARFPD